MLTPPPPLPTSSTIPDPDRKKKLQKKLQALPSLRHREVIGWWIGPTTEYREILCDLEKKVGFN